MSNKGNPRDSKSKKKQETRDARLEANAVEFDSGNMTQMPSEPTLTFLRFNRQQLETVAKRQRNLLHP